ncbi:MAG TPA: ATPase, T2SS/T4P/T4SS family [Roseiflexaceae bacterium]|nr:ATPase, T2SS/T4P/T4SS family [Roseiflexaceae bacterium]
MQQTERRPPAAHGSILDLPDETGGLWADLPVVRMIDQPEVLTAARDALLAAFAEPTLRHYLDPFAPAGPRNAAVIEVLRAALTQQRREGGALAGVVDDAATLLALFAATIGWGPAQRYLDDPRVNEVKINGCTIMVQEAGRPFVVVAERFTDAADVRRRATQLAAVLGVRLDANHPQETLPVAHGTRVHVTIAPRLAHDGALVCIRRGRRDAWDLDDLVAHGTIDTELAALMHVLCRANCSFLIAGRTGSGKTAMLEALANSWPATPHIISIEDHTLEVGIRDDAIWTRELVDTQRDPQAFGRAAREALRQTPGLLLPGETRGAEAGAILALALSGHPVITTLHARTTEEAARRFAAYAAQPGAYMYEGRTDDALVDTCGAFDVVVLLDMLETSGRRVVGELALLGGTTVRDGRAAPALTTLARAEIYENGGVCWRLQAHTDGNTLIWDDGRERTPPRLRERISRLGYAAGSQVSIDQVATALQRAEQLLAAGDAERALATLQRAWQHRRDPQLRAAAVRTLSQTPRPIAGLQTMSAAACARLELLADTRCWRAAAQLQAEYARDLALVAAAGAEWDPLEYRIHQGVSAEEQAEQAAAAAATALACHEPYEAVLALNRCRSTSDLVAPATELRLLQLREAALIELERRGEGAPGALDALQARRSALEVAMALEERGSNHA